MKIKTIFRNFFSNKKNLKKYINHNLKCFGKKKYSSDNIVLVELNKLSDLPILYSYLSNILANKYKAKIFGYNSRYFKRFINLLIFNFKKFFNLDYFSVYSSFNVIKFFYPKPFFKKNQFDIEQKFNSLKTKSDLYEIKISGVKIGDLLYDAYLRKYDLPTIDIKNKNLIKFSHEFFSLFYFWENYFQNNSIKAVIIHDTPYEHGIISRLSIYNNIPVYIGATTRLHKLGKNNFNSFEMRNYKNEFNIFSENEKILKRKISKEYVDKKFSGKKTIENKISNLPPNKLFGNVKFKKKIIKDKNKTNCLVAAHHFSDAPNAWGGLLFDDFFEWIDFLGNLSNELDYDWYIKFHPMDFKDNLDTVNFFLKKYKKFHLIERDTSHEQLISEGINLVLTGFGTIGFEYAYFKIPVINASINNPHISFDFNAHPSSIKEYKDSIINYKDLKINYDKKQLYEYFFMRYLNNFSLYPDELSRDTNMEPGAGDHSSLVYKKWLNLFNEEFNKDLKYKLTNFIDSDQYKFEDEIKL